MNIPNISIPKCKVTAVCMAGLIVMWVWIGLALFTPVDGPDMNQFFYTTITCLAGLTWRHWGMVKKSFNDFNGAS